MTFLDFKNTAKVAMLFFAGTQNYYIKLNLGLWYNSPK